MKNNHPKHFVTEPLRTGIRAGYNTGSSLKFYIYITSKIHYYLKSFLGQKVVHHSNIRTEEINDACMRARWCIIAIPYLICMCMICVKSVC